MCPLQIGTLRIGNCVHEEVVMEIELSQQQFETLLKCVHLGDWMVNAIPEPGSYISEFEELEQFLSSLAHRAGFHDVVEFDPTLSQFFLKEECHEKLQPFIDEYDDGTFWNGLVDRLADRDFSETHGDSARAMGQDERFARLSPFVEKYEAVVEDHGVGRLRIIDA
jgi:hypothetical protein